MNEYLISPRGLRTGYRLRVLNKCMRSNFLYNTTNVLYVMIMIQGHHPSTFIEPLNSRLDALREYMVITTNTTNELKSAKDAILSSNRFRSLDVEDQDELLLFLTVYYLVLDNERYAKDIIDMIHLKSTCLNSIQVIRDENLGNKWIPVLMNQMQRCSDTDRKMRL